jgi:hypothetical protein
LEVGNDFHSIADSWAFREPTATTIRAVIRSPDQYANRAVTVTGQFRGRSRSDDEPALIQPLNRSRWDFVLKSDEAAVWVSGIRPSWWDFDLDPRSTPDATTGRWLEVTGTVRVRHATGRTCKPRPLCSQIWIEATDLRPTSPASASDRQTPLRPALYPPKVVFNDPIAGETNVSRSTAVRLQFSRQMMGESFSEHVRVSYSTPRTVASPPIPMFSAAYHEATRSLEIRFAAPLERSQTVKVELLEGIVAINGRPLEPWTLTFSTGG